MPQGHTLITPLANHHFSAPPYIESIKSYLTTSQVITDNFHTTCLKSSDQLLHGFHISSGLTAMEWQHDHKSQYMLDHHSGFTASETIIRGINSSLTFSRQSANDFSRN